MFKADTAITIRRPGPPEDGECTWTELPAVALVCDREVRKAAGLPAAASATVFLIPPPVLPQIGDLIVCGGRHYTLKNIRICRDLDGRIVAARCTAE